MIFIIFNDYSKIKWKFFRFGWSTIDSDNFFLKNKETHLFLNKMLYYSFDLRKGYITHQRRLHHSTYARATSELSKGYVTAVTHQQSQRADNNNF